MGYTPILRADALDDDLDLEDEVPKFATGGIVRTGNGSDEVPLVLRRQGCGTVGTGQNDLEEPNVTSS